MVSNPLNHGCPYDIYTRPHMTLVSLYREKKSKLLKQNEVYPKDKLIVELPDDLEYNHRKELIGYKFPYKIGNGKDTYSNLPYQDGLIPVSFYQ